MVSSIRLCKRNRGSTWCQRIRLRLRRRYADGSSTEVRLFHFLVATQILGRSAGNDAALHEYVAVMRNGERLMHVLLDQKHRHAAVVDPLDDVERLLHEYR